jgi:hypothetical protein
MAVASGDEMRPYFNTEGDAQALVAPGAKAAEQPCRGPRTSRVFRIIASNLNWDQPGGLVGEVLGVVGR